VARSEAIERIARPPDGSLTAAHAWDTMVDVGKLYEKIRDAIQEDRLVFSLHAENQLSSRGVLRWQAVAGFWDGKLAREHPQARPNPKIVMRQMLPDGAEVVAVWAYVESIERAKLVTLYLEDER